MYDIDGRLPLGRQGFQGRGQRHLGISILQRHGPGIRGDGHTWPAIQTRQLRFKQGGIAERGGHQQKTGLGQSQQRHLPGDAALAVGVVMELIHDDLLHVRLRPLAQRDVRQDLRGATQDGCFAIDRGVAGAQPDVFRTELATESQPLLVDERLDRAGINRALTLGQGFEVERRRYERFARTGGRVEDDVLLVKQLQDG